MPNEPEAAQPLMECTFFDNADRPEITLVRFTTDEGHTHFAVNPDILEALSQAFAEKAQKMRGAGS
ncbi:MAG: hypothetical protein MI861_16485 [Pirellulales bacterium]|nr:hypothetical protein [Pirellulales bacterium]